VRTHARRWIAVVAIASIVAAACGAPPANGPYTSSIAPGLHPRLSGDDAVRITRDYLDAQTPQIAAPELHVPPNVRSAFAIPATEAPTLDGCIPSEQSNGIVWVTKGEGDYLNLAAHPWSKASAQYAATDPVALACGGPGPAGTIVIDDATGEILGVYPATPVYPHPKAQRS
jgi:hypothetical protein